MWNRWIDWFYIEPLLVGVIWVEYLFYMFTWNSGLFTLFRSNSVARVLARETRTCLLCIRAYNSSLFISFVPCWVHLYSSLNCSCGEAVRQVRSTFYSRCDTQIKRVKTGTSIMEFNIFTINLFKISHKNHVFAVLGLIFIKKKQPLFPALEAHFNITCHFLKKKKRKKKCTKIIVSVRIIFLNYFSDSNSALVGSYCYECINALFPLTSKTFSTIDQACCANSTYLKF